MHNFIDGQYCPPIRGKYLDNYHPATGILAEQIPASDEADVEAAVKAAEVAFPAWSKTSLDTRQRILWKIAEGIELHLDKLAQAESQDSGKPISVARTIDIPRAAHNFRFFATAITHFSSESYEMPEAAISYTLRQPIGVVGCISPWNLPLYLFTWKIAPALAAGNCVVAKPSEVTPMTAYLLANICHDAGLPKGVLNILHGYGHECGAAIVKHPKIKAISFTGSTRAGAEIARVAAPMFKKLSLELGGKNPNIIFDDCDFAQAVETTVRSSFNNQGQICLCGSRIYVQKGIYEKFKKAFIAKIKSLRLGNPADPDTQIGAVVSEAHFQKILSYIDLAKEEGGTIAIGGHPVRLGGALSGGWYIAPTVIEGLGINARCNQEEIFGPVVTLHPFTDAEEALELANGVVYGLSATIWTNNLKTSQWMSEHLQTGIVWINTWMLRDLRTPFGGVKQSGVGREGGWDALRFFTEAKNITIKK